jgi:hypothetical protein
MELFHIDREKRPDVAEIITFKIPMNHQNGQTKSRGNHRCRVRQGHNPPLAGMFPVG